LRCGWNSESGWRIGFAEIGSRHHFPGGVYKPISTVFHPLYSFMINWVLVLTYGAGMAGVALIGSEYIISLLPESLHSKTGIQGTVVVTLILIYIINMMYIKSSSRTQNLLSSLKIFVGLVLCTGIYSPPAIPLPCPFRPVNREANLPLLAPA
jgi:APA family basic amino acid/polyamine antiporter